MIIKFPVPPFVTFSKRKIQLQMPHTKKRKENSHESVKSNKKGSRWYYAK